MNEECSHRSALTANPLHLSLMHLNTQSMTSTFDELQLLLNDYPFSVVTLSETWLKDNSLLLQHVSIPGFTATYRNRQQWKGGDVGAYIRDNVQFKRRTDIERLQPEFEHMWLEFPGRNKNSKLLVGTFYRSKRIMDVHDWLDRFQDLLSDVLSIWDGLLIVLYSRGMGNDIASYRMSIGMFTFRLWCKPTTALPRKFSKTTHWRQRRSHDPLNSHPAISVLLVLSIICLSMDIESNPGPDVTADNHTRPPPALYPLTSQFNKTKRYARPLRTSPHQLHFIPRTQLHPHVTSSPTTSYAI